MQPMPALTPHLKQLRLSRIFDSLEARNRQAIDAELFYVDFLALLIEDEVARREQKKFALRMRRAAFRTSKTLEQLTSSGCRSSTAHSCTIWPAAVTLANTHPCSSSGPAAPARAIWRRPLVTARCVRVSMCCSPPVPSSRPA
jgi:hypothetical protein